MKCIRVLHVIGAGEFGGAERHILNLVKAMNSQKISIIVCCLFAEPFVKVAKEQGINVLALPMRHKLDLGIIKKLSEIIKKEDIDIVHTHGVRANLVGRLAAKLAKRKIIVTTEHSLLAKDYPKFFSRVANTLIEKISRRFATHFIAVSSGLKEALLKQGISSNKITVVYNGLNPDDFISHKPANFWRKKLNLTDEVPVVAMVGRLHPVKGHKFFLESASYLLKKKPQVRFLVVGDGPERKMLEEYVDSLGITDKVLFMGFVSEVAEVLPSIDVLVVPSLWEGFGLTALEAMVAGVPVLASSVGGLPEVVEHGKTGYLVPPGDAKALANGIEWMLEHPKEIKKMSKNAYQVLQEKFTSKVMASKTEELYVKLLKEFCTK